MFKFPDSLRISFFIIIAAVIAVGAFVWTGDHSYRARYEVGVNYYGLGKPAYKEEISGWDIDVRPDGVGLPKGSGSVEEGEMLYETQCAECHGSFGEGVGRFPVLAGGQGSLKDERPLKTVGSYWQHTSTLWDYIHRTMPFTQPESLADDEVYAVVAYVLYLNDLVDYEFVLNEKNFTSIVLPNKENFIKDERPDVFNSRCMTNCRNPGEIQILSSATPFSYEVSNGMSNGMSNGESAEKPFDSTLQGTAKKDELIQNPDQKTHPGKTVYSQYCTLCHETGVGGAPVTGDSAEWKARAISGIDKLVKNALTGITGSKGVMPAKGGFAHLTDEEVGIAVEYMMEKSR